MPSTRAYNYVPRAYQAVGSRATYHRRPRPINFSGARRYWNPKQHASRPVFRRRRRR